jgi:hypothetical protein
MGRGPKVGLSLKKPGRFSVKEKTKYQFQDLIYFKVIKKNSVRDCLINWHGYKILSFSLSDKNSRYVDKD